MFYRFVQLLAKVFLGIAFLPKVEGVHNIPQEGPCIIICNHLAMVDPIFLSGVIRRRVFFLAKQEIFETPILKTLAKWFGAFPVERGSADLAAIRKSIAILNQGDALGVFPEGTRSKDGTLGPLQEGVALIALRAKLPPIVPIYLSPRYRLFRRMHVRIGEAFTLERYAERRMDRKTIEDATWYITQRLLAMRDAQQKLNS